MRYIKKLIHGLRSPALKDEVGVYVSDGIVSPSFRKELVAELNVLASLEPKDFHPGTHGKLSVFDAVPIPVFTAFVPYIANVTPVSDEAKLPTTAWRKF